MYRYAGVADTAVPYSASLLKVAAMYTRSRCGSASRTSARPCLCSSSCSRQAAATFDPVDPSFLTRTGVLAGSPVSYDVTATKIGLGPLKPVNAGFNVSSEGTFITHRTTGKRFIVVFREQLESDDGADRGVPTVDKAVRLHVALPQPVTR